VQGVAAARRNEVVELDYAQLELDCGKEELDCGTGSWNWTVEVGPVVKLAPLR